jgi:hypothetical protein
MYKISNGEKIHITNKPVVEHFIGFKKPMSGGQIAIIVLCGLLVLALIAYAVKKIYEKYN